MTATPYTLKRGWDAANRMTASGDTDVNITATSSSVVRWTLTDTDALPAISPSQGGIIPGENEKAMTVPDGKRLWLAGRHATATIEV